MLNLVKKDLKLMPFGRKMLFTVLVLWTVLAFFTFFFSNDMTENRVLERIHIGVVDGEQSDLSAMLINSFHTNPSFSAMISIEEGDLATLTARYETGDLTALVQIPEGFTRSLLYYENKPLTLWLNPDQPLKMQVFREMMASYSDYIASVDAATFAFYNTLQDAGLPQDQLDQINDLFSVEMISTALGRNRLFVYDPVDTFPVVSSLEYFLWSVLIGASMLLSTASATAVALERQHKSLERLLTIDGAWIKPLVSKILVGTVYQLVLIACTLGPLLFFEPVRSLLSLERMALLVTAIVFFNGLAVALGALVTSQESALLTGTLGSFVLMIMGGHFLPLPLLPLSLQRLATWTPNYWFLRQVTLGQWSWHLALVVGVSLTVALALSGHLLRKRMEGGRS